MAGIQVGEVKVIKSYLPSGKIHQEYFEIHGKKEGAYKEYDDDGLAVSGTYVNGKKQGEFIEYYCGGVKVHTIEHYINDKLFGDSKEYDEDGKLIKQEYYTDYILEN